jgi:hypothetical protein
MIDTGYRKISEESPKFKRENLFLHPIRNNEKGPKPKTVSSGGGKEIWHLASNKQNTTHNTATQQPSSPAIQQRNNATTHSRTKKTR